MSRKSRIVSDIVPLNWAQIMADLDLMQKQISEVKIHVSDLGDAHSQEISTKTDKIGEKLHTLNYFVSGMCESLFNRHQCDVGAPSEGNVTANVGTKRQGPDNEEGETVGQNNPKKPRNDAPQSSSTNTQN